MNYCNTTLADITATDHVASALPLRWVGMQAIATPLHILTDPPQQLSAKTDVFVSLDQGSAKGIHMSRLYLKVNHALSSQPLSTAMLTSLLKELVASQQGLTIPYSSTCPCSAALSRQALSDAVELQFSEPQINKTQLTAWLKSAQGSIATAHSQRSFVDLKLTFLNQQLPDITALIKHFENVIGTPVQTAVKRQDEQAFAKLNASNLMFCEDAARRIKQALTAMSELSDYWFKIEHQESLHAHNAVVIDYKDNHNSAY
ncbi:GTP cyclohydrolase, FolE2/MptA family [Pseudoalteromonas prydzensis]|uniref:GTP cyclohydrolase, FolE2/MptA family n=1 Tax=Pseudoalteromonas prydzensis TaxID=182141 RepID=UPI0024BC40CB|nr:GTP cyclohydrolase, FolE2/MptA family [Pseudoalteromonas prydzensis]